jgi:hypothetical protein
MHLLPKDVKIYDGPDDDDDDDLFHWFRYALEIEESFDPEKLHHYRAWRMAKKENEELPPLPEKERLQTLLRLEAAKLAKRKRRERKEPQNTRYRAAYLTGEGRYNLRSRIRH